MTLLSLRYFIKMHGEQISRLLQPININSPRLTNYQGLEVKLTQVDSITVDSRGLLDQYPNLFNAELFVPPYSQLSYSLMKQMVEETE